MNTSMIEKMCITIIHCNKILKRCKKFFNEKKNNEEKAYDFYYTLNEYENKLLFIQNLIYFSGQDEFDILGNLGEVSISTARMLNVVYSVDIGEFLYEIDYYKKQLNHYSSFNLESYKSKNIFSTAGRKKAAAIEAIINQQQSCYLFADLARFGAFPDKPAEQVAAGFKNLYGWGFKNTTDSLSENLDLKNEQKDQIIEILHRVIKHIQGTKK